MNACCTPFRHDPVTKAAITYPAGTLTNSATARRDRRPPLARTQPGRKREARARHWTEEWEANPLHAVGEESIQWSRQDADGPDPHDLARDNLGDGALGAAGSDLEAVLA